MILWQRGWPVYRPLFHRGFKIKIRTVAFLDNLSQNLQTLLKFIIRKHTVPNYQIKFSSLHTKYSTHNMHIENVVKSFYDMTPCFTFFDFYTLYDGNCIQNLLLYFCIKFLNRINNKHALQKSMCKRLL